MALVLEAIVRLAELQNSLLTLKDSCNYGFSFRSYSIFLFFQKLRQTHSIYFSSHLKGYI